MENPILAVQSAEGAAQSAIQYFENMRNFLEAVKEMKLLTFEASDLEKVYVGVLHLLKHSFSNLLRYEVHKLGNSIGITSLRANLHQLGI